MHFDTEVSTVSFSSLYNQNCIAAFEDDLADHVIYDITVSLQSVTDELDNHLDTLITHDIKKDDYISDIRSSDTNARDVKYAFMNKFMTFPIMITPYLPLKILQVDNMPSIQMTWLIKSRLGIVLKAPIIS